MADNNEEIEVVPGSKEFEQMMFKLNQPIDEDNISIFNFDGGQLQPVQPGLFAMPAFVTDKFNLFFMVSQLLEDDWVMAFSEATIENDNEITDFSAPITTGKGLNMVGEASPDDANNLLKYFNTLAEVNRGEWRMVERSDENQG